MTSSCYLKFKKKISNVNRHNIDAYQDSAFHFDPDPDATSSSIHEKSSHFCDFKNLAAMTICLHYLLLIFWKV
jgi:hypothetical protein